EDRGQVYDHDREALLQVIDEIDKSLDVLARPSGMDWGAWHEIYSRPLLDGDDLLGRTLALKEIPQCETTGLIEEPRDTRSTHISIDKDDLLTGQRRGPRKRKSMSGFTFTSSGRGDAECDAGAPSGEPGYPRALDGELYVRPGKPKCFGDHRQLVGQNHVGRGFSGTAG